MPNFNPSTVVRGLAALVLSAACLTAAPAYAAREETGTEALEPANSLEGNFLAAYIAGAARDTAAAATFYREAIKADPRNTELLERAFVAFLADGSMPEAFRTAERLAARDGTNGLAQLVLGVRSIKARQYGAARTHLSKGGRGRQADLTATLLTAWAHAGAGEGKKALEAIERLKNERAFTLFRDYHAGLIADLTGNTAEAERRLKAAYEAERNTLRIVDAYARFEAKRGNRDRAVEIYKAFDAVLPRHPVVRTALDQLAAGKALAPIVSDAQQGSAEVLYGLGAAGSSSGDELPALIYLRLALHLDPEHPMALVTLADTYERLKQLDRANEVFSRVPKDSPLRASADIAIGSNLEQLDRGAEAVAHLEALMKERPDDIEVIMAFGNVLRSRKEYARAAEVYTRAVERIGTPDRGHWVLFFYRGTSYERAKQWEKAEADLKRALELVPETLTNGRAQVLNYLAYSWVDMGINIDEAFKMLQRAVELAPRDGMIIDSLGWAYYRLGRYEDAVRELEKAVELKPGDPTINDHLGDAYWRVGRRLEARFQWDHAKALNPEHEDLIKILKKIDHGLEEDPKPAAAENAPAGGAPAEPQKNGG
ncbi:MAG: tetratricopeptide repeat protein [Pseudomonadota bacterium]|nr:tetratricopeptide repeat protein [Pseudomonadota bacterium]